MIVIKIKWLICFITFTLFVNHSTICQLKDNSNKGDYLIITPSQFVNSLQTFVYWRQQKNLDIKLVELPHIYSEFPNISKSHSIREFVSYALSHWKDPKPKYLLLVGGISILPSYRVSSRFADYPYLKEDSVSIDEWYSINQFESDTKPDIALGRFPVNNEDELNSIIMKTMNYEDSLSNEDYSSDFIFLTDKTDSSAFEHGVNSFINSYLPSNFSKQTIFGGQSSTIQVTKSHLLRGLAEGTLFLSYYGHGAPDVWSDHKIFTIGDIDSLKQNGLPFIYTSAACSQSFDLPDDSSIVRKLIVLPKSGTVASIAATGLNFLSEGLNFLSSFYNNIFTVPNLKIGEAVLKTKGIPQSFIDAIYRRYTLLGDPALKIHLPIISHVSEQPTKIQHSYTLKQNYPNPFNPSTIIEYSIPKQSFVTLAVYDLLGQKILVLVNEEKQAGTYQIEFNGLNLASGIYFYRMESDKFIEIKKFVLIK